VDETFSSAEANATITSSPVGDVGGTMVFGTTVLLFGSSSFISSTSSSLILRVKLRTWVACNEIGFGGLGGSSRITSFMPCVSLG
jgi:hypothetical protein